MVLLVAGSLLRVPLPEPVRPAVVAAALGAVLLKEAGVLRITLPENRRLVPESVFRLGRHLGPLQFGIEMGTGARTYLPSGLPYAGAVAVLLLASAPGALCAGAGFGLGRALMTTANLRYAGRVEPGRAGGAGGLPPGARRGVEPDWNDQWLRHAGKLVLITGASFAVALIVLIFAGPG